MKKIKNLLTIAVFLLVCAACFYCVNALMLAKDDEELSSYYYDYPDDTFDVIVLGPSVMKNAVQPVILYEDYGIASYNLSCGNQSLACSYYVLQNAIEKDSPELVVLDMTYAEEIFVVRGENAIHYLTDRMPYTNIWRNQMIEELVTERSKLEYYFPFYSYHTRWKELTTSDFTASGDYQVYTLGAKISGRTMSYDSALFTRYDTEASLGEIPREYFEKIIALCKENDIDLLLTCCPVVADSGSVSEATYNERLAIMEEVAVIAAENDIPFLNFLDNPDALNLDVYNDFQDGVHLNLSGADKFTDFIGLYISMNYDLPDRREDTDAGGLFSQSFSGQMEVISENYWDLRRTYSFSTASRTDTYLDVLAEYAEEEDLLILVCAQLMQGTTLSDTVREGLEALGLTGDFTSEDLTNYIAVLCAGEILATEQAHFTDDLSYESKVEGIRIELKTNSMSEDDEQAELVIRGADVVPADSSGIYIAVYDMDDRSLLDCAALSFDGSSITHFEEAGN